LAAADASSKLICIGRFQNLMNSRYIIKRLQKIGKFYMKPRFETFVANVAPHIGENTEIYPLRMDVHDCFAKITKLDMMFIDAIKDPKKLAAMLGKVYACNADAIVVGDDLGVSEKGDDLLKCVEDYAKKISCGCIRRQPATSWRNHWIWMM
jgi:hypothetical protein